MAVPGFLIFELDVVNGALGGPITIPTNNGIRAHTFITAVTAFGGSASSGEAAITSFVQSGTTHTGTQHLISGNNISEITWRVSATNGSVKGLILVEIF